LKIASLPLSLFAENNSGATPSVTEQKYERAIATATFGELLKFVLFAEVGFIFQSHLQVFFKLSILLGVPFLNNHDL